MPAESQKLIAYGKVMDNPDATLKDHKIAEGGFIVVMMQKVSGNFQMPRQVFLTLILGQTSSC